MSRLEQIIELENRYLLPTYNRYPVALEKGKGVFLYDFEGKKYLDFVAGLGVNALGHAHPRIVKTIREQAAKVIHIESLLQRISGTVGGTPVPALRIGSRLLFQQWYRGH